MSESLSVGHWYDLIVTTDQWNEGERNALMDRVWAVQQRRRVELHDLHDLLREVRAEREAATTTRTPADQRTPEYQTASILIPEEQQGARGARVILWFIGWLASFGVGWLPAPTGLVGLVACLGLTVWGAVWSVQHPRALRSVCLIVLSIPLALFCISYAGLVILLVLFFVGLLMNAAYPKVLSPEAIIDRVAGFYSRVASDFCS